MESVFRRVVPCGRTAKALGVLRLRFGSRRHGHEGQPYKVHLKGEGQGLGVPALEAEGSSQASGTLAHATPGWCLALPGTTIAAFRDDTSPGLIPLSDYFA